nr:uncharacterized mitochondrial protein AtMg00810-like [Aegilops tauschii subsp. strangulata]
MVEEYGALLSNNTWDLVDPPRNANIVTGKWIYRHMVLWIATKLVGCFVDLLSEKLDVKNAFLNGTLTETVYARQPSGFTDPRFPDKPLLELSGLSAVGFIGSKSDSSLFVYRRGADMAYLLLYVDDIILTASSSTLLHSLIASLRTEFSMRDMGDLHYFLGISVTRSKDSLFLSQEKYALDLLDRAGMLQCKTISTPVDTTSKLSAKSSDPVADPTEYRSIAGGLRYLTFTRPDISYAVQQICLHIHDPRANHLLLVKRVLRYIRGTTGLGLTLFRRSSNKLMAYSDADWAGCPDTRWSTSGYCVFLGTNLVSWSAKRQHTVSPAPRPNTGQLQM